MRREENMAEARVTNSNNYPILRRELVRSLEIQVAKATTNRQNRQKNGSAEESITENEFRLLKRLALSGLFLGKHKMLQILVGMEYHYPL